MTAAADTSLAAVADRLGRAADRIEAVNWDGDGLETPWERRGPKVMTEGGVIVAGATKDIARRVAAFDPFTTAALVPLLRKAAKIAAASTEDDLTWMVTGQFVAGLDVFARRLLGEEDGT